MAHYDNHYDAILRNVMIDCRSLMQMMRISVELAEAPVYPRVREILPNI